ncbi:lipoprotein signal peptidase [Danxiaibacter flavus]|uniref:Lipoprotein signal peptidase n=1 Tax=Danxiaibacter flavus TaxID=3049108 RepID=A0ABV3ZJZ8_9BACT|nr:lipoprotein signal peptidase [Chitinophagaceae bacterium DXS]
MKGKQVILLIAAILVADQAIKLFIKTHYYLGEEHKVIGNWFRLHFVENEGMAWGWKFGGGLGKVLLTMFRLVAVIAGTFIIRNFIRKGHSRGFIICASLIYAGALGNLIDSMFYGLIFNESDPFSQNLAQLFPPGGGYAGFLHGKVVDMFYFPLIDTTLPSWIPFWGGERFEFFQPVFNLADASISVGVIVLFLFQKRLMPHPPKKAEESQPETIVK